MKIVLCGGHLTPALALIERLQDKKNTDLFFFGRKYSTEGNKNLSAEYRQLGKNKLKFVELTAGRLQRKFTRYTIPSLIKIPIGFIQSFINLLLIRPAIVVSFGGYLSLPVVFCAWFLGIDSIAHEQSSYPGLANRINAIFAKKIFLTWPQTQQYFPKDKSEVVGNLWSSSIQKTHAQDKNLDKFLQKSTNLIFVTGGNQGSHFLNVLTRDLAPKLKGFSILHQVGTANYKSDMEKSKRIKNVNYMAVDYLDSQNIGAAYNFAQLVISRSGANTVWDLAQLAKVAILIPLPISASDEQAKNAQILEAAGSALVIPQKEATVDKIEKDIYKLFKNLNSYQKKALDFSKTLPEGATAKVVKYILS